MRKKIIFTVVLGALLSINVCMAKNFSDLASSHWGYQAITKMSETGIVSGYPDGTFRPDNSITRAEFSSILVRSLGLTKKVNYEFNDIDSTHWAFTYINVAGNYLFGYENTDGSIPEWVQPDSTNAYMKGDKVKYNEHIYESLIDNNIWSPDGYPAGWQLIE